MESALIVWPQLSALVAAMILLFTVTYVAFQRQEVRAQRHLERFPLAVPASSVVRPFLPFSCCHVESPVGL
jgi:hypothetical protein